MTPRAPGSKVVDRGVRSRPHLTTLHLNGLHTLAVMVPSPGRTRDDRIVGEQAALRRVAVLVASGAAPEAVFAAVAEEVGRLLEVDCAILVRYDPPDAITVAGTWTRAGGPAPTPVGSRLPLGGRNVTTLVYRTGRPERIDYDDVSGQIGDAAAHDWRLRSSAGVPIRVEGRLWGVMVVAFTGTEMLPADAEPRLAEFLELAATAVANAQARTELRRFAEEQSALRRVATLVARGASPKEVFGAVAEEVAQLMGIVQTNMLRYDPDGFATMVAVFGRVGDAAAVSVGDRYKLGGRNATTLVFESGRPARIGDYAGGSGAWGDVSRHAGYRSSVGVPISVEGRLWGVIGVVSPGDELPPDTEERLAGFTELAATAIANAEAQAALTASRARIVATADATRRRIERDLHDGAQQRLVSLALQLRAAQAAAPPGAGELVQELDGVVAGLTGVVNELREIAHGIHPAVLTEGGLRPALKALARRCAIPVRLDVQVEGRLPEQAEIAAYYVVAEALTNTAKHAHATTAEVEVAVGGGVLRVRVGDDGRGGAYITGGSGVAGLKDRADALGGRLSLHSPPGAGTTLEIALPIDDPTGPQRPPGAAAQPNDARRLAGSS
jgi:signal transduction histidine kinase